MAFTCAIWRECSRPISDLRVSRTVSMTKRLGNTEKFGGADSRSWKINHLALPIVAFSAFFSVSLIQRCPDPGTAPRDETRAGEASNEIVRAHGTARAKDRRDRETVTASRGGGRRRLAVQSRHPVRQRPGR